MFEIFTYSLYFLFYKRYKVCPATSCGPCSSKILAFKCPRVGIQYRTKHHLMLSFLTYGVKWIGSPDLFENGYLLNCYLWRTLKYPLWAFKHLRCSYIFFIIYILREYSCAMFVQFWLWFFLCRVVNLFCHSKLSLLHLKRSSSHIAAALRSTWALLFWSTWPAAVDRSRS